MARSRRLSPPSVPPANTHHGITIEIPNDWLYDKLYPGGGMMRRCLTHLKAKTLISKSHMAAQGRWTEALSHEMRAPPPPPGPQGRRTARFRKRTATGFYWSEFEEGAQYRKHWRKPVAGGEARIARSTRTSLPKDRNIFRLGAASVSQNGRFLAFSTDTNGSERYTARIKDLLRRVSCCPTPSPTCAAG